MKKKNSSLEIPSLEWDLFLEREQTLPSSILRRPPEPLSSSHPPHSHRRWLECRTCELRFVRFENITQQKKKKCVCVETKYCRPERFGDAEKARVCRIPVGVIRTRAASYLRPVTSFCESLARSARKPLGLFLQSSYTANSRLTAKTPLWFLL